MSYLGKTGAVPKPSKEQKKKDREKMNNYKIKCDITAQKRIKTAWKWFSLWRRLVGCFTSHMGIGTCKTCGARIHYTEGDAGHYVRQKNHGNTVFEPKNVHLQCKNCNMYLNGNEDEHAKYIDHTYGEGTSQWLIEEGKKQYKRPPLIEVEQMIAKYKQLAKDEAVRVGVEIK